MSLREKFVLKAGELAVPGFAVRASAFGVKRRDRLERFNLLLAKARAALPAYDAACASALAGRQGLASLEELHKLPVMRRADLAGYPGSRALARLESGGTGSAGRVETRLDLKAVVSRYASLLSVLKAAGWTMGDKTAAFHPVEYSWFANLPAMLARRRFGGLAFEFVQQYLLYRLVHNRKNLYYGPALFASPEAAAELAQKAEAEDPVLLITRPDALMAVLKSLRSAPRRFRRLKAVLTVGTALGETVRREAKERLGAEVFNMYASTELGYVALSCPASEGWLHADGADHILETKPGGGVLCTDLDNELTPLLRYDTGDIAEVSELPCPCGRPGVRLRVRGRKDKYAEAGGNRLYEADLIDKVFPSDLPFFQLDADSGALLHGPGRGPEEAARVRELLGLPARAYSTGGHEKFRISSSGKFCYLP
jgi:phenylacetate-coenzyme A ligase PaaK-like adenylate-forming protein